MAKTLYLSVNSKSQTLPSMDYEELFNLSYEGIVIYPVNGDVVLPWDADISIKSGSLVLNGWAYPGDATSSCVTRIKLGRVSNALQMTIEPKDDKSESRIREIMSENNWVVS